MFLWHFVVSEFLSVVYQGISQLSSQSKTSDDTPYHVSAMGGSVDMHLLKTKPNTLLQSRPIES